MKIAFTSDLHVDVTQRNRELLRYLVEELSIIEPDVFIVAGDVSPGLSELEIALKAFSSLSCEKLFVAGNHDVWSLPSPETQKRDTKVKYVSEIMSAVLNGGFTYLVNRGRIIDGVAFVGAMGWFDYSLRNRDLDSVIVQSEYECGRFKNLQWNDFVHTDWWGLLEGDDSNPVPAGQVARWMTESITTQIESLLSSSPRSVVVCTHFLPTQRLIRFSHDPYLDFSCAYLGSEEMESLTDRFPQISYWIAGHIHAKRSLDWSGVRFCTSPVGYLRTPDLDLAAVARNSISWFEL